MDPQLISTCELIWAWAQSCLCKQVPQGLSVTPISLSQSPLPCDGHRKSPAGHSQCLGLTFQVRLLSSEETDHSLQLAELPVVGIDVCDAVNPGGKGRRNPKGQRETTVRQMLLDDNNCKKEISKKLLSEKSLPILLRVVSTLKSNSVAVSQTPPLNPTPINLTTVLSRALQHELTMQQSCSKSCQHFPVLWCVRCVPVPVQTITV